MVLGAAPTCVLSHVIPHAFCIRERTETGRCCDPHFGLLSSSRRRRGLPWPYALRRSLSAAQMPWQMGSGYSWLLFGQPLAAFCMEDDISVVGISSFASKNPQKHHRVPWAPRRTGEPFREQKVK